MTPKVTLIFISQVMSKCSSFFFLTFILLFLLLSKRSVANECSFQQLSPVLLLEVSDARGCSHDVAIHILKKPTGKMSGNAEMQKKKNQKTPQKSLKL